MDRISGANYNTVDGLRLWQDRNQTTGQAGTFGNALFFNGVQEELMAILAAADVTPNANNWSQVLTSLQTLFGGGGNLSANGWQRLAGGLMLQWMFITVPAGATNETYALPTSFLHNNFAVFTSFGSNLEVGTSAEGSAPDALSMIYATNTETSGVSQGTYIFAIGN